jgi:fimbrial chaperone protein
MPRFPFLHALYLRCLQALSYGLAACACACVCLAAAGEAEAANLQISPVSIAFEPGQGAAGINLQNFGDTPLYGQVRVYTWEQKDGIDVLTPTGEVVASPPIIEVAARSTQTIRLVRRKQDGGAVERSYRILIDEIPRNEAGSGVAIRLQYSVPVFVAPTVAGAAPALSFSLAQRDGKLVLRARNDGAVHAQIGATRVRAGAGAGAEVEVSKGLLGYALAGQAREWQLSKEKAAQLTGPLTVVATVNAREASFPVAPAAD